MIGFLKNNEGMSLTLVIVIVYVFFSAANLTAAFVPTSRSFSSTSTYRNMRAFDIPSRIMANQVGTENESNQVLELIDTEDSESSSSTDIAKGATADANDINDKQISAPFLSQGEINEEAMEMDWSDPKQQRVLFYIILSLLPVLFLIPLMLASRDFPNLPSVQL